MPDTNSFSQEVLTGVCVDVRVCVGGASPTVKELMQLGPDAVLPLDSQVDDPVELYVGEKLIAKGFLEASEEGGEGNLAVRLTEVGPPSAGLE